MYKHPEEYAEAWNFGPEQSSIIPVWDIAQSIINNYKRGELKDASDFNAVHEAKLLALDISKARFKLGWVPTLNIDETIKLTVDWYKDYNNTNVYELCKKQIIDFSTKGGYE